MYKQNRNPIQYHARFRLPRRLLRGGRLRYAERMSDSPRAAMRLLRWGLIPAALLLLIFACRSGMREGDAYLLPVQLKRAGQMKTFDTLLPLYSFVQEDSKSSTVDHFFFGLLKKQLPFFCYAEDNGFLVRTESMSEYERLLRLEGMDGEHSGDILDMEEAQRNALLEENRKALEGELARENARTYEEASRENWSSVPGEKQFLYSLEEYQDYETLIKEFYAIDATTMADESLFDLDTFLGRDMTLQDGEEGPQILIYHTHSQEGFADSVAGDESTTIVGVGDHLTELLQKRYGLEVLHHKGVYDLERDYAYTNAAPALEQILEENPSIQVVIDLHRDEVPETTRLVTEQGGKPMARFMFFNGLSRTKKTGEIEYLKNPYLEDNLAFAFQMQLACNEYYPGLTRKIYLKGYRYNMHYCPKTLLIELGAQNNTVEEAYNSCEPLAHILAMVLQGE